MNVGPGWRRLFRLPRDNARRVARDIDDEIAFHLEMREEKLRRSGVLPNAARDAARARFGDPELVRDECVTIDQRYAREVRLMEWLDSVFSDLRYAFRTLRRRPAFTLVAMLTLAVGIGATTAMFTLVNGILLRPLPYPHADRIVQLIHAYPEIGLDHWGISQENIAMYRDRASDFEVFAAYRGGRVTLTGGDRAIRLTVALVTADFFRVLGVGPARGRAFTRDEDTQGRNNVIILSDGLWRSRFGGRTDVIGSTMDLDGRPTQIVGIMPPSFQFPGVETQAWLPMGLDPTNRHAWFNAGLALLRPGVSIEHAHKQTTGIMWDWARREPELIGLASIQPERTRMATIVRPLQQAMVGDIQRPLQILLAAVGLILLIAIANVATLLSSRATVRQREIGLRTALGATRRRVTRQLLTESVALAVGGAAIGVALAFIAVRTFTHSSLIALPRLDEVRVDARVLAVTLAVTLTSGVLFGLLPAMHSLRSRLASDLTSGSRESAHRSVRRVNNGLVVAQLSLSVVLLIASGLVLESFRRLTTLDLGFRPDGVTSISLPLPPQYKNSASRANPFFATLLERVRATPGVTSAALAWGLPFEGNSNVDGYLVQGRPKPPSGNEGQTYQIAVTPGYFATLGIPLLYGRDFGAADDTTSTPVVIVDESIARKFWAGPNALGKQIRVAGDTGWSTIVGVVGAIHDDDATQLPAPHMYASLAQLGAGQPSLAVRARGNASPTIKSVRSVIAALEPSIPLDQVRALTSVVGESFATRRLTEILLASFAAIAVVLAGVGIYGVMSLSVANRQREFGVRLAVGAAPAALVRLVLREGAAIAALGVGIGVLGALVATRGMTTLLYGVSPTDPLIFVSLPVLLGAIAVASCYVPARRASKADPLVALRAD
ncbi:MAG TPA: ABC transporter permease [Gemmatimonadaceae bacterium]